MSSMDKWAPSAGGVRDPRDPKKKNSIFWNWPRYLFFGGAAGAPKQAGDKPINARAAEGQGAVGPISDRGKGRR